MIYLEDRPIITFQILISRKGKEFTRVVDLVKECVDV